MGQFYEEKEHKLIKEYKSKAHLLIPGGAHTYSRGDDQYPENAPSILERGEGCYVWDLEGNKFLDYVMALRAVTVGYGYKRIADAAIKQIMNGNNLPRPSKIEVEAAEKIVNLIDSADMVKFAKNGSTVTTAAVKLSRAITGKKRILRCLEQPFFSYDDWFIGDTCMNRGVLEEFQQFTHHFHFNDIESARKQFNNHPGEFSCVILEPATHIEPYESFLNDLMDLTHKNGAIFILDEMITGFRWHLKGAQYYYNIRPDLTTFGKGMANGFSVAALTGKREIMELGSILNPNEERVFLVSTTHGAEMCGLGALAETINVYQECKVVDHMWKYGTQLKNGMNAISEELKLIEYFNIEGTPVSPTYVCKNNKGEVDLGFRTLFSQEMIKCNILMPFISLSFSHGNLELEQTLDATRKALITYSKALEDGLDKYLIGKAIKPVFRKWN